MCKFSAAGLTLSLGMWLGEAYAQELPPPASAPAAASATATAPAAEDRPALVTLGRPKAVPGPVAGQPPRPIALDQQVAPASFSVPLIGLPRPVVRTASPEVSRPLPPGPLSDDGPMPEPLSSPNAVKSPAEKDGTSKLVPVPSNLAPPLASPSPLPPSVRGPVCVGEDGEACGEEPYYCLSRWWRFLRWDDVAPDDSWLWARGEYLLWWMKESPLPPLVTSSPPGTARGLAGVLGAPGTSVLFPDNAGSNPVHSGGRFSLGFWFDCDQTIGLESTTLFLGERSLSFQGSSGGLPILARPFVNVMTGMEASELVAFPGVLAGGVAASSATQLWGTELNLRLNCWRGCFWHVDWLNGVRFLALEDKLNIAEGLMVPPGAGPMAGSGIVVQDNFGTHNLFVGGQTGLDVGWRRGRWSIDLLGKVALGNTHETLNINGNTQFAVPGMPTSVQPGGLYALPSNIGRYTRDRFTVVPEAGFTVGFQVTRCLRFLVGYSFLYSSNVLRAGSQIDRTVNVTQLPSQIGPGTLVGAARPTPLLHGADFWAQGVSLGLELRY